MDNKGKNIFMACVGGYLMYTGYSLIVDVLSKEPENKMLFLAAGGIFVIVGLATIFMNLKAYFKDFRKDVFETEENSEEELETIEIVEADAEPERQNHVEIVNMTAEEVETEEESTEE